MFELISEFKSELVKIAKYSFDELSQMLDNGLAKYIGNFQEKYEHTKTFLISDRTVPFYDVYFELSLCPASNNVRQKIELGNLFKKNNCISIIGQAGSGKSMIMRHCFLSALSCSYKIPIVIELRRLNNYDSPLEYFIADKVFCADLAKNTLIFERLLKEGRFLFLLDGFDELALSSKQKRTDEIENFIDKYPNNHYLLSSRPDACNIERFETYNVSALTEKEVETFVHVQTGVLGEDGENLKKKIISEIRNNTNKDIAAYLTNPLLLSMFILTFESHPEIPTKRSTFYFNVFDTLYTRHDTSKGGAYIHERKAKLERSQYNRILKTFCFQSYFKHNYSFSRELLSGYLDNVITICKYNVCFDDVLYDLSVSIGILIKDGLDYCFPHRSMQEYFTASFIKSLPEDKKKENVYPNFKKHRGVGETTLWMLCDEIDMCSFNKYFILPTLQEYIDCLNPFHKDAFNEEDKVDMFYRYANLFSPEIEINKYRDVVLLRIKEGQFYMSIREFITKDKSWILESLMHIDKELRETLYKHTTVNNYGNFVYNCCTRTTEIEELYKTIGIIDRVYHLYEVLNEEYNRRLSLITEQEEQNKLILDIW